MKKLKIFIIFLLVLPNSSCQIKWTDAIIYYIPYGYKGVLLIIYNQQYGEEAEYENGKRIYRFNKNGILLTQFPIRGSGIIMRNDEVYWVKEAQKFPINYLKQNQSNGNNHDVFFHSFEDKRVSKSIRGYSLYAIGTLKETEQIRKTINTVCLDRYIFDDTSDIIYIQKLVVLNM